MSTAKIAYSVNGEDFIYSAVSEVFDNLEASCEMRVGAEYFSAEVNDAKPSVFFDLSALIHDIEERVFEQTGHPLDDFMSPLTPAQREELKQLVSEWLDKNITANFWTVKNIKTLTVTAEDILERGQ